MNHMVTFCAVYRNEARVIRQTLDLAKSLFPTLILAVQESEDNTLEICKQYATTLIQRPSESPEESRDFVMEQVKTPWCFWLDADEFPSLPLIHYLEQFEPAQTAFHDAYSFIRINYVDGVIVTGGQGEDRQFKLLKKEIRWNPQGQGRRIHIYPQVTYPQPSDLKLYHLRTLEKIKRQTERWNELDSSTKKACDQYVKDVEAELCQTETR